MYDMGVQDSSIIKSLGLFGLVLAVLIFLVTVYYATKCIKNKRGLAHKLRTKLEEKLFYSSILRYFIVSNLKLNYTISAFLISKSSFETF